MTSNPMDLPEEDTVTTRQLVDELMGAYEDLATQLGNRCDQTTLDRMPDVDWDLIRQLSMHRPTLEYLATSNAATYLRHVIKPAFARIRNANEAACDLADMLMTAAQEAEDKK